MDIAYNILTGLAILIAAVFVFLVMVTGKADAMSGGGGGVRTSFKGKASLEDRVNQLLMILAGSWVGIVVALNIIAHQMG